MIEKVTYYGTPRDPFTRIVETYKLSAEGVLDIERTVYARGQLAAIDCEVKLDFESEATT